MPEKLKVSICAYRPPADLLAEFGRDRLRENVSGAMKLLETAAASGSDLAVLPEIFAVQHEKNWPALAEPLDGFVVSEMQKASRRLGMGIAFGHPIAGEHGKIYNSAVLLGKSGDIIFTYNKSYPTIWELENGVCPGDGAKVVDCEFGRLGFAVCFDLNFHELRRSYAEQRPDMIAFLSAFRGGLQTRWWAYETRCHLISSVIDCRSLVVNPLGRILASTDAWNRFAAAELRLDCGVVHLDYSNKRLDEAMRKYGRDFTFEIAEPEGVMLVSSLGGRTFRSLVEEMGWEVVEDYFGRARNARGAVLSGAALESGPPPW